MRAHQYKVNRLVFSWIFFGLLCCMLGTLVQQSRCANIFVLQLSIMYSVFQLQYCADLLISFEYAARAHTHTHTHACALIKCFIYLAWELSAIFYLRILNWFTPFFKHIFPHWMHIYNAQPSLNFWIKVEITNFVAFRNSIRFHHFSLILSRNNRIFFTF